MKKSDLKKLQRLKKLIEKRMDELCDCSKFPLIQFLQRYLITREVLEHENNSS